MIEYVLVYAYSSKDKNKFILVEKQKPDWQKGFYNLVGGKVESFDRSIDVAMLRELKEETGLDAESYELLGTMKGHNYICYCYQAEVEEKEIIPGEGETERVFWTSWPEVKNDKLLLLNLRLLIPLCQSEVNGWELDYITNTSENSILYRDLRNS